ncbi:MAG: Ppx/GppA phosphatase family protein [Pseudomonadota bacterium]
MPPAGESVQEVAAVDLGSNSFHMMVARAAGAELQVVDRLREPVRLAGGLDADKQLSAAARDRALACLEKFGQRLKGLPASRVSVVGTSTLRRMKNRAEFLRAAESALGHSIGVISGREEGRLVYAGVTHGMGLAHARRLVVDIGGGSTELIIGHGTTPKLMESAAIGCVAHTQEHFADGEITHKRFQKARLAARRELEFLERRYRKTGWDLALGSSGTIRGAWRVMKAKGWIEDEITREALEKCVELVTDAGHVSKIEFDDLREDRRPVFAGGLAVLAGVFDSLGLERMQTSERALREGVLYDLLGRLSDHDVRDEAVSALAKRYGVDVRHAQAVERTALRCLDQVSEEWRLDKKLSRTLVGWAARLHEIGLVIAHSGYHKHGEYILRHADLQGFSQTDQSLLAALVRLHRGKFTPAVFEELPEEWVEPIRRLAAVLRLSVLLHRSREGSLRPSLELSAGRNSLELKFRKGWLQRRPLTQADLEQESDYLKAGDFRLKFD